MFFERLSLRQRLAILAAGAAIGTCWLLFARPSRSVDAEAVANTAPAATAVPDADQLASLGVAFSTVEAASSITIDGLPAEIIEPLNASARVAAPFAGVVTQVLVDDGQDVIAGQPLLRIQSRELLVAVADAARARSEALLARQAAQRDALLLAEGIIPASRNEASAAQATIADAAHRQTAGALGGLRLVESGAPGEHELLSPMTGRVLHRSVSPGRSLAALEETFSIAVPGTLDLTLNVPITLRSQLKPGLNVHLPDGHTAHIVSIGGNTERASQSLRVRARLDDAGAWVPGQHLQVSLQLPVPAGSVKVPSPALLSRGDRLLVLVKEKEQFRTIDVVLLGADHDWSVISAALEPGTQVVSRGAGALKATLAPEQ